LEDSGKKGEHIKMHVYILAKKRMNMQAGKVCQFEVYDTYGFWFRFRWGYWRWFAFFDTREEEQ